MIGLEYILSVYRMQHIELAEKLGIKKQNINLWIKGKQKIPKKYLPILQEIFGISSHYFVAVLTEIEKLEIQKEKLKCDLQHMDDETGDLVEVPIYDKEEINVMEWQIENAKLVSKFKAALEIVEDNPYSDTFTLIVDLLEKVQHEGMLHKTVKALAHYFEVLPNSVSSGPKQDEFESALFQILDDYNY